MVDLYIYTNSESNLLYIFIYSGIELSSVIYSDIEIWFRLKNYTYFKMYFLTPNTKITLVA